MAYSKGYRELAQQFSAEGKAVIIVKYEDILINTEQALADIGNAFNWTQLGPTRLYQTEVN